MTRRSKRFMTALSEVTINEMVKGDGARVSKLVVIFNTLATYPDLVDSLVRELERTK